MTLNGLGFFIYYLVDSTGAVRYVGRSKNPYARQEFRWTAAWGLWGQRGRLCNLWMGTELHAGRIVEMIPIARYETEREAIDAEREEIARCFEIGCDLMNACFEGAGHEGRRRGDELESSINAGKFPLCRGRSFEWKVVMRAARKRAIAA